MALRMGISREEVQDQLCDLVSEAERGPYLYEGDGSGSYARTFLQSSAAPLAAKLRRAGTFRLGDYSLRERVLFYTLLFATERAAVEINPHAYAAFRSAYGILRPQRTRIHLQAAFNLPDFEHGLSAMMVYCLNYQAFRKDRPEDLQYYKDGVRARLEYEYDLCREMGADPERDEELFRARFPSGWERFVNLPSLYRGLLP